MSSSPRDFLANQASISLQIYRHLQDISDLEQTIQIILTYLKKLIQIEEISIYFENNINEFNIVKNKILEKNKSILKLCNLVMEKKTTPDISCFTAAGSFWINNIEKLTPIFTSDKNSNNIPSYKNDLQDLKFNSIALIPIPYNGKNIGMIQLFDSKINLFSEDMIYFMEMISNVIGSKIGNHLQPLNLEQNQNAVHYLKMCAWCKKVSDDGSKWDEIEKYLFYEKTPRRFGFTHGCCPECLDHLQSKMPKNIT